MSTQAARRPRVDAPGPISPAVNTDLMALVTRLKRRYVGVAALLFTAQSVPSADF
jgi:hypothetical protein